jgi:hypothetical protein
LNTINLDDPKISLSGSIATLGVGQQDSTSFTGTYDIIQDDIDAGVFTSTSEVTAVGGTQNVSAEDSTPVPITASCVAAVTLPSTLNLEDGEYIYGEPPPPSEHPDIVASQSTSITTLETIHTVAIPADVETGDTILILVSGHVDATITPPDGFDVLADDVASNSRSHIAAKKASGTEGETTVDFTFSTPQVSVSHAMILRFPGAARGLVVDVDYTVSSFAVWGGGTVNALPVTAAWGSAENIFIATGVAIAWWSIAPPSYVVSGRPADYDYHQAEPVAEIGQGTPIALVAARQLTAGSDDPGNWIWGQPDHPSVGLFTIVFRGGS